LESQSHPALLPQITWSGYRIRFFGEPSGAKYGPEGYTKVKGGLCVCLDRHIIRGIRSSPNFDAKFQMTRTTRSIAKTLCVELKSELEYKMVRKKSSPRTPTAGKNGYRVFGEIANFLVVRRKRRITLGEIEVERSVLHVGPGSGGYVPYTFDY